MAIDGVHAYGECYQKQLNARNQNTGTQVKNGTFHTVEWQLSLTHRESSRQYWTLVCQEMDRFIYEGQEDIDAPWRKVDLEKKKVKETLDNYFEDFQAEDDVESDDIDEIIKRVYWTNFTQASFKPRVKALARYSQVIDGWDISEERILSNVKSVARQLLAAIKVKLPEKSSVVYGDPQVNAWMLTIGRHFGESR